MYFGDYDFDSDSELDLSYDSDGILVKHLFSQVEKMNDDDSHPKCISFNNKLYKIEEFDQPLYILNYDGMVIDILPPPSKNMKLFYEMLDKLKNLRYSCCTFENLLYDEKYLPKFINKMRKVIKFIDRKKEKNALFLLREKKCVDEYAEALILDPQNNELIQIMVGTDNIITRLLFSIVIQKKIYILRINL